MKLRFQGYVPEPIPSGAIRHRVRVEGQPGRRITIPVGPDHPDFSNHYAAARAGKSIETTRNTKRLGKNTLDELISEHLDYMAVQVEAGNYSILTLKQRKSLLIKLADFRDPVGERIGSLHREQTKEGMIYIRDHWGKLTAQADNATKALRTMYKWAIERGKVSDNPAVGVANIHRSRGGAKPWSAHDLRAFLNRHGPGTTPRLWLFLAMFTGCRIGDAFRLGRKGEVVREGRVWLDWQPSKRGSKFVSVPVAPQLLAEIKSLKVVGTAYILSSHGRPYRSSESLRNMIEAWTGQAGLKNRTQHGVRKALAELLAEAGASNHQIMAVMSHTKPTTTAIYTDQADRRRLAASAMEGIKAIGL